MDSSATTPRKLILRNFLSPGDIVMLTAAVRDLHLCHPNEFLTDVRTPCPHLWENNPYLAPLEEIDPDVTVLPCHYPLIHRSNELPVHFLQGFVEFLNEKLDLRIRLSAFKGDIHLSDLEKTWWSQVREMVGEDVPFWIIVAGGKRDFTIKWWDQPRFQAVVDHFRGKLLFVQVGERNHWHPALEGVIDLRGQTDLRQLVRLMYHAQGVLCPVTLAMHLAAAVEVKGGRPKNRACVVVAGGREPSQWEAYPHHQYIHTNGALLCCDQGGCWKARTVPLGDGDPKDRPENLCVDLAGPLPRCMDLITPEDVVRRIQMYFDGHSIPSLSPEQWRVAEPFLRARTKKTPPPAPKARTRPSVAAPETFAFTSPYQPTWWSLHPEIPRFRSLFGGKVIGERDFLKKSNGGANLPGIMVMHNFIIERAAVVSLCRERGLNVVHTEDGFFPHYATQHADPLGFCWESSLPQLVFRSCADAQRKRAQAARGRWLAFGLKRLPDAVRKPYVFWPLQLIGDRVNRQDLDVKEWTGLLRHFRACLPAECQLVLKAHPRSKPHDNAGLAELLPQLPNTLLVPGNTDLKTLLHHSCAVAGANSSVLFEARLMFHKPVYAYARSWFTNHSGLFLPIRAGEPRPLNRLEWLEDNRKLRSEYLDDYTDWFLAQLLARQFSLASGGADGAWLAQTLQRLSYASYQKYGEEIFLDALEAG